MVEAVTEASEMPNPKEIMNKYKSQRKSSISAWIVLSCCLINALFFLPASPAQAAGSESGPIHNDGLIWPVLKLGARKPSVRALQYLLRSRGYKVVVDGKFEKQTQDAVKRYQRAHKLKVDGVVAAYTWEAVLPTLQRGSSGDAVRATQTLLNWQLSSRSAKKSGQIPVDGDYGEVTERAVRTFQQSIGIMTVTGKVADPAWCYLLGGRFDGE